MAKKKPRIRCYNVPRGTATDVALELGLARSHITRVINGDRLGGERLVEALEIVEKEYFRENAKAYKESMKGFRARIGLR